MSNLEEFKEDLEDIEKLVSTPNLMKDTAISGLQNALNRNLDYVTRKAIENVKLSLENISDSSIKENYKVIYLQMLILAVSRLEATLKNYFLKEIKDINNINKDYKKLVEIKLSALDLIEHNLDYTNSFGEFLLDKETNSFQNLKLIKEIFKNYLNKEVVLDESIKQQLIYYLEVRHVLVHRSGKIDDRFVNATSKMGSNLKSYKVGDRTELTDNDWGKIKNSFIKLVEIVTKKKK